VSVPEQAWPFAEQRQEVTVYDPASIASPQPDQQPMPREWTKFANALVGEEKKIRRGNIVDVTHHLCRKATGRGSCQNRPHCYSSPYRPSGQREMSDCPDFDKSRSQVWIQSGQIAINQSLPNGSLTGCKTTASGQSGRQKTERATAVPGLIKTTFDLRSPSEMGVLYVGQRGLLDRTLCRIPITYLDDGAGRTDAG